MSQKRRRRNKTGPEQDGVRYGMTIFLRSLATVLSLVRPMLPDAALFGALGAVWAVISFRSVERWFDLRWSVHMEGWQFNFFSLLLLGIAVRQSVRIYLDLRRHRTSFARMLERFPKDVWMADHTPSDDIGRAADAGEPADGPGRSSFLDAVTMIAARESTMARSIDEKAPWGKIHGIIQILQATGDYAYVTGRIEKLVQQLRDTTDHRMVWPRTIFWVIPSIGFLGTVSGISGGIVAFTERAGLSLLSPTTKQLGIAFDATFIALFATVVVTLFNGLVEQEAGRLFSMIEHWLLQDVVRPSVLKHGANAPATADQSPAAPAPAYGD